jgi:hypothetical protein
MRDAARPSAGSRPIKARKLFGANAVSFTVADRPVPALSKKRLKPARFFKKYRMKLALRHQPKIPTSSWTAIVLSSGYNRVECSPSEMSARNVGQNKSGGTNQ